MNVINTIKIVITALSLALPTSAHSWIEEYQVIDSNGKYIGDKGYSRGYIARTDPAFTGSSMTYLIPQVGNRINPTDMLCHPDQRTSNYFNPAYPKLKVQPGGYVAMKYLENGHVTLPWNHRGKPKPARTVFWPTQLDYDCTYPDGKDEYYSTCADFDIVDENDAALVAALATNPLVQQDP
ncbi:hypothetical protein M433DRAFT_7597 [Acidomyces richmondensis BFW]|nr:hypothetical protein M433DRAFT_7597 [Acidomyces richmondensis BFW]